MRDATCTERHKSELGRACKESSRFQAANPFQLRVLNGAAKFNAFGTSVWGDWQRGSQEALLLIACRSPECFLHLPLNFGCC
eukprot:4254134-Amphidinium_carterae.1